MALQGNFATAVADLVTDLVKADIVNINEAIWEDTFGVGNFSQGHTLVTNRRNGQLQPIVSANDYYGAMPVGDETSCDLNECDLTPNYSAKEWCLAEHNCRIPICMRSFDEEFLTFWNMYRQTLEDPTAEPDAQAYLDYIEMIVRNQILGTQWRVGYWGDSNSANDLVNGCDGFFAQADAGSGTKVLIGAASPNEPTGEELYDAFKSAYEAGFNTVWGGQTDVVWKTTNAVAAKLVTWLNTIGDTSMYNCDCYDPNNVVGARRFTIQGLRIFGIPVESHREIDLSASASGNADPEEKWKALLIRKSNLLVGTNTQDKLEGFDMFYDKTDRKIYVDSIIRVGVMIPLDQYVYISEAGS